MKFRLSHTRFRTRIFAGFALMVLTVIVVSSLTFFQIISIGKKTKELNRAPFMVRNALTGINLGIKFMYFSEGRIHDGLSKQEIVQLKHDIGIKSKSTDNALLIIERNYKFSAEHIDSLALHYKAAERNLIVLLDSLYEKPDTSPVPSAFKAFRHSMVILESDVKLVLDHSFNHAVTIFEETQRKTKASIILLIVIVFTVISVGAGIGYILARSVSNPIKNFLENLKCIYKDKIHLEQIAEKGSEQELFDSFIAALQTSHEEILTLNEELKTTNEELRVFNEELEALVEARTEQLNSNQEQLLMAHRTVRLGHFNFDFRTGYWSSSETLDEIFGIEPDYVKTVPTWAALIHEQHRAMMVEYFETNIIQNREEFDKHYIVVNQKTKKSFWVHGKAKIITDENNNIVEIFGTIQDINEQKLKDIEIQQKNEELQTLNEEYLSQNEDLARAKEYAENIAEKLKISQKIGKIGSWSFDFESEKFSLSEQACRIFNLPENSIISRVDFIKFVHPDDTERVQKLWETASEAQPFEISYKVVVDDKTKQIFEKADFEFDDNGKPITANGIYLDISDLRKIENKLEKQIRKFRQLNQHYRNQNSNLRKAKEEAELANKLKTEFLHNISHEVRTPMNAIIGFSKLMISDNISTEKRNYFGQIIINNSHNLLRIIDDILEISRLETDRVPVFNEKTNIRNLLQELYDVFEIKTKEKSLQFNLLLNVLPEQSNILTDSEKLRRIVSNLLSNALKFTLEGRIELSCRIKDEMLEIAIKDSGLGISSENARFIFQRFSQEEKEISRKAGGLGLGLAIAKENAELLGGSIRFVSEKGMGSEFIVSIPYRPVSRNTETNTKTEKPVSVDKKAYNILIAEDEETNFLFFCELIESLKFNFHIERAVNGRDAVEKVRNSATPDIIFMDLKMPMMSGFEATQIIGKEFPDIPILALTAYSTDSEKEEALRCGCKDFITKPIDEREFARIVNKYLRDRM